MSKAKEQTSRELAMKWFKISSIKNNAWNWHIYKRAFDLGYVEGIKSGIKSYKDKCVEELKRKVKECNQDSDFEAAEAFKISIQILENNLKLNK